MDLTTGTTEDLVRGTGVGRKHRESLEGLWLPWACAIGPAEQRGLGVVNAEINRRLFFEGKMENDSVGGNGIGNDHGEEPKFRT